MQYFDFTSRREDLFVWAIKVHIDAIKVHGYESKKSINFIYPFMRIMVTLIGLQIWNYEVSSVNYEVSISIINSDIYHCKH